MGNVTRTQKFRNQTQRLQSVAQVILPADGSQSQRIAALGERLFLMTLAAFDVDGQGSHPGNEKLALACGVKSRQAVNKIADRLEAKKLIEILEIGNGRGKATVYRICYEDARFPAPKSNPKPATQALPFSGDKPATPAASVFEINPQRTDRKPATRNPETRNAGGDYGFNTRIKYSDTTNTGSPDGSQIVPPRNRKQKSRTYNPAKVTSDDHLARFERNMRLAGLPVDNVTASEVRGRLN
jgi:hypothetical protein